MAEKGSRTTGVVASFNISKGFGFIKSENLENQLFVHHTSINSDGGFRTLSVGSTVEFTIDRDEDNRLKAVDVTGPGGSVIRSEVVKGDGNCYACQKPGHMAWSCPEKPTRGNNRDRECRNCKELGHIARDCPEGRYGGDECYNCGKAGHFSRNCREKRSGDGGGGGSRACYECNEIGHIVRDCPSRREGGQGDWKEEIECHACQEIGHIARECPRRGSGGGRSGGDGACFGCGEVGHLRRDCTRQSSGGAVRVRGDQACFNCGDLGHFAKDCVTAVISH